MSASPRSPFVEELVPAPDPIRCCEQLEGLPYLLFLDSATRDPRLGRYSYVTADPCAVVRAEPGGTDPLATLRTILAPFSSQAVPGLPPFQGGAAGYVAYDWGLALERLPAPAYDDLGLEDLVLGVYDWVIAWDHAESRAWIISTGLLETEPAVRARRARERATMVRARLAAEPAKAGPHVGSSSEPAKAGPDVGCTHRESSWGPALAGSGARS